MKRALIERQTNRVLQVEDQDFDVHEGGMYWVDCPDDTGTYYLYDPENLTFEDPHAHSKDEFGNPVEPFNMQRMRAYPPSGEQLDMLFKELRDTGTISKDGAWFKSIQAVKAAIPKPIDPTVVVQHLNNDGTIVDFYNGVPGSRTTGKGKNAVFNFRKSKDLGLQVAIITAGNGYAVGDEITIPGSDLEETADLILAITEVDTSGGVVTLAFI